MSTATTVRDIYGLTPLQEGIYFHSLANKDSQAYFCQSSYRIEGGIDERCVAEALEQLFDRHAILRSSYVLKNLRKVVQVVRDHQTPDFAFEDLRQRDDAEGYMERQRVLDRHRPFDLARDVLMRVRLYQLSNDRFEFVWSHHHILMDGWCTGILLQEFGELYDSIATQRPHRLPPTAPYHAFIQWLDSCDKSQAAQFWKQQVSHLTQPSGLPTDKSASPSTDKASAQTAYDNREVALDIDADLTARIQAFAAQQQTTLNTLLQGLWSILLSRYLQQADIVFGTVVSVRPPSIPGIETMVGLLINTLPVCVHIDEDQSIKQLLTAIQAAALNSTPYQYYPLADIQGSSPLGASLVDHVFVMGNFLGKANSPDGSFPLTVTNTQSFAQVNYNFSINIYCDDALHVRFTYNGNVYSDVYMKGVSSQFGFLLQQLVNQSADSPIASLQLLTPTQQTQLLHLGEGPRLQYPAHTLAGLFALQVHQRPNQPALSIHSDNNQHDLSYQQLDHLARRLAQKLTALGISRGDTIASRCHRSSPEMILAILACSHCAAIYTPVDPQHPADRTRHILSESKARLLLTAPDLADPDLFPRFPTQIIDWQHLLADEYEPNNDTPHTSAGPTAA
ncbi:MAG TPA: condensation domain-containing protein, partial [Puia sp.]|uniref:condensation domain-containing protein n=1 Tax=Puia sp. TaxID=2045100 RepID=UPI002BAF9AB7